MKLKDILTVTFGTFVLIILGDGVVANVGLAPRLAGTAYNWNTITLGWAVAVYISIWVSGGDHNPAFTLAGALRGAMPLSQAAARILCQMVGAFLGAGAVYLAYRDGLVAAGMPNVWSTGPGSTFGSAFWGGAGSGAASAGPYAMITASLTEFFGVFASEQQNVIRGVDFVRHSPIIGPRIPVHGLMVDTATGKLDWIVNGYDALDRPTVPTPPSQQMHAMGAIGAAAGELVSRASAELSGLKMAEAKIGETTSRVSQWVSEIKTATRPPPPAPKVPTPPPVPPPVELRRRIPVPPRIEPPPKIGSPKHRF